jgi:hypothetical protein
VITSTICKLTTLPYRINNAAKLGIALSDYEAVLYPSKAASPGRKLAKDPYNKTPLKNVQAKPDESFLEFYTFIFNLAKAE